MVSLMVSWSRHGTVSIRSVHLGALPSLASENMSRSDFFFHLKISLIWLICFCFFLCSFFVSARLGRFQTRCCSMALLQPLRNIRDVVIADRLRRVAPRLPPGFVWFCWDFRFRMFEVYEIQNVQNVFLSLVLASHPRLAPLALPNGLSSCHKHFLKPRANWLETTLKNFATEGSSVLRERSFSSCQCCDAKPQISGPVVFWDFFIYQSRGKWNEISSISWFHDFFSLKLHTYIVI